MGLGHAHPEVADARAPTREEAVVGLGSERACLQRRALDELGVLAGVARATVDGHHARQAELTHDRQVAAANGQSSLDRRPPLRTVDARIVLDATVVA